MFNLKVFLAIYFVLEIAACVGVGLLIGGWNAVWLNVGFMLLGYSIKPEGGLKPKPAGGLPDFSVRKVVSTLFMVPGFLTDVVAVLILIPPVRRFLQAQMVQRVLPSAMGSMLGGAMGNGANPFAGMNMGNGANPFAGMNMGNGANPFAGMNMGNGANPFAGMNMGGAASASPDHDEAEEPGEKKDPFAQNRRERRRRERRRRERNDVVIDIENDDYEVKNSRKNNGDIVVEVDRAAAEMERRADRPKALEAQDVIDV